MSIELVLGVALPIMAFGLMYVYLDLKPAKMRQGGLVPA
jgi:hypothetical protein